MKRLMYLAMVVLLIGATSVSAQVPNIGVYFDDIETKSKVCPGGSIVDTLYIVARDVGASISEAEYRIEYSPSVAYFSWLADIPSAFHPYSSAIGSSPTGVSLRWDVPGHDVWPIVLQRVLILWNCFSCSMADVIRVLEHPATNFLGVADFSSGNLISCVGLTSLVCPAMATHDKTWGAVKSLYE